MLIYIQEVFIQVRKLIKGLTKNLLFITSLGYVYGKK
jgi:hypothetical protein